MYVASRLCAASQREKCCAHGASERQLLIIHLYSSFTSAENSRTKGRNETEVNIIEGKCLLRLRDVQHGVDRVMTAFCAAE